MENNQPPPLPAEPPRYSQQNNPFLLQQQQQLQMFWTYQRQEIERTNDFKSHQLPLARIKKIMKADEDVRMISAEAPVLFSKACELFILELTIRSWLNAEENKRRTLQRDDIAAAITGNQFFDFMIDIVPRDEIRDAAAGIGIVNSASGGIPYNYLPMGHPAAMTGLYMQPPSMAWQSVWQTADDESYIGRGQQQGGNVDGQS